MSHKSLVCFPPNSTTIGTCCGEKHETVLISRGSLRPNTCGKCYQGLFTIHRRRSFMVWTFRTCGRRTLRVYNTLVRYYAETLRTNRFRGSGNVLNDLCQSFPETRHAWIRGAGRTTTAERRTDCLQLDLHFSYVTHYQYEWCFYDR